MTNRDKPSNVPFKVAIFGLPWKLWICCVGRCRAALDGLLADTFLPPFVKSVGDFNRVVTSLLTRAICSAVLLKVTLYTCKDLLHN